MDDSPIRLTLMGSDRAQVWSSTSKYISKESVRPLSPQLTLERGSEGGGGRQAEILQSENRGGGFLKEGRAGKKRFGRRSERFQVTGL